MKGGGRGGYEEKRGKGMIGGMREGDEGGEGGKGMKRVRRKRGEE